MSTLFNMAMVYIQVRGAD